MESCSLPRPRPDLFTAQSCIARPIAPAPCLASALGVSRESVVLQEMTQTRWSWRLPPSPGICLMASTPCFQYRTVRESWGLEGTGSENDLPSGSDGLDLPIVAIMNHVGLYLTRGLCIEHDLLHMRTGNDKKVLAALDRLAVPVSSRGVAPPLRGRMNAVELTE